jgi:lipopolysaccharide transport system ATP-binding protein
VTALAIKVENVSKAYQLGEIGTGTISRDIERWYAKIRGKEDPFLKIGETNDRSIVGTSDIVWSLRDINFEIQQGEAVGIIGRNGAGKSTLLKILSRITSPTTGRIRGNGRISSLLEVGTGFNPELTGRENIFLNGAILGMRKAEIKKHFDAIVDFSGVERYIDTPVKRYSSGMYVRLAFAVAAHLESEILIVDEVLAVGDAEFQKKCLGKMGSVSKGEGRTVLFVSHNMASIQNLCTRGIVLEKGEISFVGSTQNAINKYSASHHNSNLIKLTDRNDRKGNGLIKVTDISILNQNNEKISTIYSGQNVRIVFAYYAETDMEDIVISLAISNTQDTPIFLHHNRLVKKRFNIKTGAGSFTAEIEKIPLPQDSYFIAYSVSRANDLIDMIEYALSFDVTNGDFFGFGEVPPSSHGVTLVDVEWTSDTAL